MEPPLAIITDDGLKLLNSPLADMRGHQFLIGEDVYLVFSERSSVDVLILEEVLVVDLNAVYLIPFS